MEKDSRGFFQTIAWKLPKQLIYYCLIRGWANATTGEWSNENASTITADEMIKRWDK